MLKTPSAVSPEVLGAARERLQKFAGVAAGLTFFATAVPLASDEVLRRAPAFGNLLAAVSLALVLDFALYFAARDRGLSIHSVMTLAVGYFVLRVAVLSFGPVRAYLDLGLNPPVMTFGTLLVALLPLFVPKRPLALLLPSSLSAAVHPLALVWLTPSDSPTLWPMAASDAAILLIAGLYLAHVLTRQRLAASQERSFGDYHLTALIGQGAIGEVWRAEHELLVRPAAIKLVTPRGIAGEERAAAQRRFEREARVTALLTSPHTVTVYDYGLSDEGACYSVMELLEGEDLQRRVERAGPLSPEQTVAVALQVCDSLAEAHERGLVHRDLKPANLFMARIGCDPQFVKVLDFGFAELIRRLRVAGDATTLATVRVAGTPAFMAPETLLEQEVDARADLYQLACTMFYLLTGHLVFERRSVVAMAFAQVHEPAPLVSTRSSQPIPAELEAIIARCLKKQPKHRFRSAEALEAALRAVRFDSALPPCPPSIPRSANTRRIERSNRNCVVRRSPDFVRRSP